MKVPTQDYLRELVREAEEKKRRVLELDEEQGRLREKLSAFQSEAEAQDLSQISADDEASLLKLTSRQTAISILPEQIEALNPRRDSAVFEMLPAIATVRSAVEKLALIEQTRLVEEISRRLRPYCLPTPEQTQPGKIETIDTAKRHAWNTSIIFEIGARAYTRGAPDLTFNGHGDHRSAEIKKEAVAYAEEVLAVARWFLENGGSFIPSDLFPNFKA